MQDGQYVVSVHNGQASSQDAVSLSTWVADHPGVSSASVPFLGIGIWAVLIIVGLIALFSTAFIVKQQSVRVIQRLGKFKKISTAGLNFKVPFIDHIAGDISLKIQQLEQNVDAKSKDNAFINIPVKVQFKVVAEQAEDAFYQLTNAQEQMEAYITNIVRSTAAGMTMDEVFQSKDTIQTEVNKELNEKFGDFGFSIVNVLVDNPLPSVEVRASFDKVISSQRLKEAATNEAEATRVKTVAVAAANAESLVLTATAYTKQREIMSQFFKSIPEDERNYLIGLDYRDMVRDAAKTGAVLIVPSAEAGNDIGKIVAALKVQA